MEYRIGFCERSDGVSIAFGVAGKGSPVVYAPGWVSHLETTFQPPLDAFYSRMAEHHTLITYDKHGTGLSDRDRKEFTLEAERRDLEAIIEHFGLERFDLVGASEGGPPAISYAVAFPERVRHLVLYATYAQGSSVAPPDFQKSFVGIVRASWGVGSRTITDMFGARRRRGDRSPVRAHATRDGLA